MSFAVSAQGALAPADLVVSGSRSVLAGLSRLVALYFLGFFVLTFTQVDRVLWGWGVLPLPPTVGFIALAVPMILMLVIESASRPTVAAELGLTLTRNFFFVAPLLLLSAANLLAALRPEAHWDHSGRYLLLVPYDCLVFLVGLLLPILAPVRRFLPVAAVASILLLASTVFVDVVLPGQFSRVLSRAAGVARDPNVAAFLLCLALTFCLRFGVFRRRDLLLLAIVAAAIVATLSRQGMLLFALLLAVYAHQAATRGGEARFDLKGLMPVALASMVVLVGLLAMVAMDRSGSGLFSVHASSSRLEMWTGEADWFEGRVERFDLARQFIDQAVSSPLLGHGTAYTYTFAQGPHNRYLQEWVNAGLLGVAAYIGWFLSGLVLFGVRRYLPGLLAVGLVALDSFFAHGILEQRAVPLALGLAATVSLFAPGAPLAAGKAAT